jgi:tetratricopeptide (TPR) repeat protein
VKTRPILLLGLAFVSISASASAQSTRILGKDNAAFARALLRAGFSDLAEGVCKAIADGEKDGKAERNELIESQGLALELRLLRASREPDLIKRKDEITAVIAEKEKFASDHPRSLEGQEARNNLPDAYRMLGEALTEAVKKETDPAVVAKLKEEGEKAFNSAEKGLNERLNGLKESRLEPEKDAQYMAASFNLARTYYFHARFYPAGEFSKMTLLKKAQEAFAEFGMDYTQELLTYEAMIYIGLCHKDMDEVDDALAYFNDAISLRDNPDWNTDSKGLHVVPADAADTISAAVLQKVLLLHEKKRDAEAIEAANDFFNTVADAIYSAQGLPILAAMGEAQAASGDSRGAGETAQKLVEYDQNGRWGARGRDMLAKMLTGSGGGGALGVSEMIKVAENLYQQGKYDQALEVLRLAVGSAKGDPKEQDIGAQAMMLMGAIYNEQNLPHEASLVFDQAAMLYPKGKLAPDALSRAIDAYMRLNAAEKRPFYKKLVDERSDRLQKEYPTHPEAARVQLKEGREFSDQGDFLEAAKVYERITPGSASYEEAEASAGTCYYRHAVKLVGQKKAAEAAPFFAKAETVLKKALADLDAAEQKTLDSDVLSRIGQTSFTARATLCQLYLKEGVNRPADALALLEGLDQKYASDAKKIETIWTLRINALVATGKLQDAVSQLDALLLKNPNSTAFGAAAGVLARTLDEEGVKLREKEPRRADELWDKAAKYYWLSVKPKANGDLPVKVDVAETVATRLLTFGMHFAGVPETSDTFVGWKPSGKSAGMEYWEQAATLLQSLLASQPSDRSMINLGRCQAFLGRWKDSASTYATLFEQVKLVNQAKTGFNNDVVRNKGEMVYAYLEWGVAELEAGKAEQSSERLTRASGIFDLLAQATKPTGTPSRLWWQAKYYQIHTLLDRGLYEQADIALRDIKRTAGDTFDNGEFKPMLQQLETEIAAKIKKPASPPPEKPPEKKQ